MKHLIIAISLLAATPALAQQNRSFYGANGEYLGQARSYGGTTSFYGEQGEYQGQARSNSYGKTDFYGQNGEYQGQMNGPAFQ